MSAPVYKRKMAELTLTVLVQALHQTYYDNLIRYEKNFYSDQFFSVHIATLRLRCSASYNLVFVDSALFGLRTLYEKLIKCK